MEWLVHWRLCYQNITVSCNSHSLISSENEENEAWDLDQRNYIEGTVGAMISLLGREGVSLAFFDSSPSQNILSVKYSAVSLVYNAVDAGYTTNVAYLIKKGFVLDHFCLEPAVRSNNRDMLDLVVGIVGIGNRLSDFVHLSVIHDLSNSLEYLKENFVVSEEMVKESRIIKSEMAQRMGQNFMGTVDEPSIN